jgi:hypothetical protein
LFAARGKLEAACQSNNVKQALGTGMKIGEWKVFWNAGASPAFSKAFPDDLRPERAAREPMPEGGSYR